MSRLLGRRTRRPGAGARPRARGFAGVAGAGEVAARACGLDAQFLKRGERVEQAGATPVEDVIVRRAPQQSMPPATRQPAFSGLMRQLIPLGQGSRYV